MNQPVGGVHALQSWELISEVNNWKAIDWKALLSSPGDDFTNSLRTAFASTNPKIAKRHWRLDWPFAILGFSFGKAVCKHFGEIDPCMCFLLIRYKSKVRKTMTV